MEKVTSIKAIGLFESPQLHWGLLGSHKSELLLRRNAICILFGCLLSAHYRLLEVSIRIHRY